MTSATRYLLPATCRLPPAACYPPPATRSHLSPATCAIRKPRYNFPLPDAPSSTRKPSTFWGTIFRHSLIARHAVQMRQGSKQTPSTSRPYACPACPQRPAACRYLRAGRPHFSTRKPPAPPTAGNRDGASAAVCRQEEATRQFNTPILSCNPRRLPGGAPVTRRTHPPIVKRLISPHCLKEKEEER